MAILDSVEMAQSGPVTGEAAANIKKALKAEIEKSTFDCKWNVTNGPSNTAIKSQINTLLDDSNTTLYVNDDNSQPVITAVTKSSETEDITMNFTTTPDLKKITKVDASRDTLTKTEVNTGTLINPRFEIQVVRTADLAGSCSVK